MLVVECWFDCGGDRALGFGATGDISSLSVRAWAAAIGGDGDEGLDKEATRLLVRVIRRIDAWRSEREAERRRTENM